MDFLLIDYGKDSMKVLDSKNNISQVKKLYKFPNQKIDLEYQVEQNFNDLTYSKEHTETSQPLKNAL